VFMRNSGLEQSYNSLFRVGGQFCPDNCDLKDLLRFPSIMEINEMEMLCTIGRK
ncbi:hypothetical protein L9F63_024559, partial [Diploptera punctata]